jgi:phosphoglycolate phosphatase
VATLNSLRAARALPLVTRDHYRARFGFPVKAFYEEIGFDFTAEDFAALSRDFHAEYRARAAEMRVMPGAREALAAVRARGAGSLVVSAMESEMLGQMLASHDVAPHLEGWHGRDDLTGDSKVALGVAAVRRRGLDPGQVLLVGDTVHDHELGQAIGCQVVLYAGGHQTRARLEATGAPVIDSLAALAAALAPRAV